MLDENPNLPSKVLDKDYPPGLSSIINIPCDYKEDKAGPLFLHVESFLTFGQSYYAKMHPKLDSILKQEDVESEIVASAIILYFSNGEINYSDQQRLKQYRDLFELVTNDSYWLSNRKKLICKK